MNHFLYRLIPPRPSFGADMSDGEAAIMRDHVAYWTGQLREGRVVGFGPVADPADFHGVAIIEVNGAPEAVDLGRHDPAVTSGLCHNEICPMPQAIVRPHHTPAEG